ncbi:gliding motility-associated C-terminal domain-containing protein [Aridibaculum aurantiacum]|uniref:gliding motility-associated C-terminal domain-containing protein n=1 Tax=Aridibaculum aurantiacum TaxID=2810307 RepID=UPI001A9738BF|nr:gliding motility-associated C-terminal domain-containing protein [Aridibaculum aurantiacum]
MNPRTVASLLFLLLFSLTALSQKQWSNWYMNGDNLLTFRNNNIIERQRNFVTTNSWLNFSVSSSSGVAYSDPATGQMKFLLSSIFTYDRNFDMLNTPFLRMCPGDKYSYHILPFHNNPNKFYIVQFQSRAADALAQETGLQVRCPNAIGLGYSVFDLSLNNGLGDYQSINNVLLTGLPERISAVRHANGFDVWIVVHTWGSNEFKAYLFSDSGVATPVSSFAGPVITGNALSAHGNMVASHDGTMLAAQQEGKNYIELYNFNNATGMVSNFRSLQTPSPALRFVFSPDDTKLYFIGNYLASGIYQFNLSAPQVQQSLIKIGDDPHGYFRDLQVGLDGKIYISSHNYYDQSINDYQYFLPVISCPNLPEYACNYKLKGFHGTGGTFQNFINDYVRQPTAPPTTKFSIGNDTAVCFGSYTLTAPQSWQRYEWNTGDTTRSITITGPGTYYVLASNTGFSCPSGYGYIKITNAAAPLYLGRDTTLCPKTSYDIVVPANFNNILWSDGSTDRVKTVVRSGSYALQATDQNGCTNRDTINVSFRSTPVANFGNDTSLCNNQTLLLELKPRRDVFTTTGIYEWQDGSARDTFRVRQAGVYWGKVTYNGCTVSDTITVSYVNAQDINLGPDTTLCLGDSLQLQVTTGNATFAWSTGATTPSIYVKSTGRYWVRVNNGSCTVTDTINVTFRPKPVVNLGNDTIVCEKSIVSLRAAVPGATYLWQNGATTDTYQASQPGIYWVQVNSNGCVVRDSILITNKMLPYVNLGRDSGICQGKQLVLNAAHPSIQSFLWHDNSTQPTMVAASAGTYSVSVVGTNGCTNADTIQVTTNPLPVFSLGSDTSLCQGQKFTVSINVPNASYTWNNGNTSNQATVEHAGWYWLDVAVNGCKKRDSLQVEVKPLPLVSLGNDTTLCEGNNLTLNAYNNNATYLWNNQSNQPALLVSAPGTYFVTANLNNCKAADTIQVAYRYKPVFSLGADTLLCAGQHLLLNPRLTNVQYLWQNGTTGSSLLVTEPGTYSLTASNNCGSKTDEIIVTRSLCKLFLPTAFTPNNDGLNDLFRVKYPEFIKVFEMKIYNRWGQMVYHSTDPYRGWNGKFLSLEQPQGNYVWQVSYTDIEGNKESAQGSVLLIR